MADITFSPRLCPQFAQVLACGSVPGERSGDSGRHRLGAVLGIERQRTMGASPKQPGPPRSVQPRIAVGEAPQGDAGAASDRHAGRHDVVRETLLLLELLREIAAYLADGNVHLGDLD